MTAVKKHLSVCVLAFGALILFGCGERPKQDCPTSGEKFFTDSLKNYFSSHDRKEDMNTFRLAGEATYDGKNKWWIVPFDTRSEKLQALLSCDGHLEITGR